MNDMTIKDVLPAPAKKLQRRGEQRKRRMKHGGRKEGTLNKTTQLLSDLVIEAAVKSGSDLKGKDGLIGYLMRVGRRNPKAFGSLLRALLPLRIDLQTEIDEEKRWTLEDFEAFYSQLRKPLPFWVRPYFNGGLEEVAEQLEKEFSLEVKLLPKN